MSTTPTPVEDDLDTGRMIASRWRPATLRTTPSKEDRGLFGHPRGLPWMLNVEMWERFSYYGMRAILLYFITDTVARGGLGLSANSGQVILASYSAAVYLLAIPGGIFADRIIGPWLSTLYGGVVIMAGHICLSIPTPALAWTGIVLVAVGTGFIKPNLSTIVGGLYDDDDPRRDAGFQLFYMSVNLGSLASPLVTGWLREHYGYHAGFFSAAVGMGVALIAFIYGRHKLSAFAFTVPNPIRPQERRSFVLASLLTVVAAAALVSVLNALTGSLLDAISATMLIIPAGAALGYFVLMFRSPKVTARERTHLRAYIPLWIGAVLFFMISEQAAGKMATFAKDNTDGTIPWLGWAITPRDLPVHQPGHDRHPGTIHRLALHPAGGQVSLHHHEVRDLGAHHRGIGLHPGLRLPDLAGRRKAVPLVVPGGGLHHPDRRRALPVPGGPVHDVGAGTQELRFPDDEPVAADDGHWSGAGRLHHLQDGEHRELHLLLRPGGCDGRRGHHPVHRRPVDGAEDGRRRGHGAGLGGAGGREFVG